MSESHFELSANSTTYLTITSCQRFNAYLERSGLDCLIEQMQKSNALQIAPQMHQHLAQEFERLLQTPLATAINTNRPGITSTACFAPACATTAQRPASSPLPPPQDKSWCMS